MLPPRVTCGVSPSPLSLTRLSELCEDRDPELVFPPAPPPERLVSWPFICKLEPDGMRPCTGYPCFAEPMVVGNLFLAPAITLVGALLDKSLLELLRPLVSFARSSGRCDGVMVVRFCANSLPTSGASCCLRHPSCCDGVECWRAVGK